MQRTEFITEARACGELGLQKEEEYRTTATARVQMIWSKCMDLIARLRSARDIMSSVTDCVTIRLLCM